MNITMNKLWKALYVVFALIGILSAFIDAPAQTNPEQQKTTIVNVITIVDGDTLTLETSDNFQFDARLNYIDAPESEQSFGKECKTELENIIAGKPVRFRGNVRDRFGRRLVELYTQNYQSINDLLLFRGCAWIYTYPRGRKTEYKDILRKAKIKQENIWSEPNPCKPKNFRANRC